MSSGGRVRQGSRGYVTYAAAVARRFLTWRSCLPGPGHGARLKKTDPPSVEGKRESVSLGDLPNSGIFACSGEYWTIGYGGKSLSRKDVEGVRKIKGLLRHPREEFPAPDLLREPITQTASRRTH